METVGCGFVRIRNPDGDTVDGGGIAVVEGVDEDPDIPAVIPAMNAETITRRIIPPQPMAIHSTVDLFFVLLCGFGFCGCGAGEVMGSLAPHFGQNGALLSII
ncbi:MAG: hypothetical protein NTV84_06630 [Methanoregula sp.]|nr:hypothetical protein [Methanoregula sp.]